MSIYRSKNIKITRMCRITPAIILLSMLFWSGSLHSQVHSEDNVILVSGQIVNNVNGAPISSHKIYIESDSSTNNGFNYYSTVYTDVNGFFFDTVNTTNNSGYIDIYLYDFNENLVEASKYYRFNWEDEYQLVANFQIFDPNANQTSQANFKSDEIPENELKIHFKDRSSGFVIKAWHWDFGDGNFSEIQDPIHEYEEPGIYYVTLTISSKPMEFEYVNVSKITKRVMVGLPDYYSMGGHVYAPPFPIDYGQAYLYKLDQNENPVAVDTAVIDTLGYYYFYALIEGDYIIKARLTDESVKYGEYIPTYFGYSFDWEEADIIEHDGEHFNYHVYLIKSDGTKYGDGEISGQITYDTNTITTTYAPAEDIEIILMDGSNICLTCRLSDLDGNFSFNNLRHGTYQIFPEVTGVRNHPMFITISDETPGNSNLNLVIQPQQIMFSIAEPESEMYEGDIVFSPNPFHGQGQLSLNLSKSSTLEVIVADSKGSVILHQTSNFMRGNQIIPVDLNSHPSGLYHLMIRAGDGSVSSLKLLKQ